MIQTKSKTVVSSKFQVQSVSWDLENVEFWAYQKVRVKIHEMYVIRASIVVIPEVSVISTEHEALYIV